MNREQRTSYPHEYVSDDNMKWNYYMEDLSV